MGEVTEIFDRLELPTESFPPEVAEYVLGIRFSEQKLQRYESLAERHNNGELSAQELRESDAFVEANAIVSLLKARARKALAKHQPAA